MARKRAITDVKTLALMANAVRHDIVDMVYGAQSGHPGGALGMADIFTCLYWNGLVHDPKKPNWDKRDRLILSNGHICAVLYSVLARSGYFPQSQLKTFRHLGGLQGHPHREAVAGIENSSGPLGEGLGQGVGMALAAKMDGKQHHVIVMGSDGEHQEGSVWEAVMAAAKWKLDNLIYIMDRNYIQIEGDTEKVMPLEPVREKYEAFGWHVIEIDGHNYDEILDAIHAAKRYKRKPVLINAITVLGRGVSYMEDVPRWHGEPPKTEDVYNQAIADLDRVRKFIQQDSYDY